MFISLCLVCAFVVVVSLIFKSHLLSLVILFEAVLLIVASLVPRPFFSYWYLLVLVTVSCVESAVCISVCVLLSRTNCLGAFSL